MPRKRHIAEEIIHKLREAEISLSKGLTTAEVTRQLSVTDQADYRWRVGCTKTMTTLHLPDGP